MNLPNVLSLMRVLLIPTFVAAFVYGHLRLALGLFVVAALSDVLDGYLARIRHEETALGKLLDPLADKCLMLTAFTLLRASGDLPAWVLIVVFTREVIVVGGWILRHLITKSSTVVARMLGKATIVLQSIAVASALLARIDGTFEASAGILLYAAVAVTAVSGLEYLYRGVKELGQN